MPEDFAGTPTSLALNAEDNLRKAERLVYMAGEWMGELALMSSVFRSLGPASERCCEMAGELAAMRRGMQRFERAAYD